MTDALRTLLELWGVPRMNLHRAVAVTFGPNPGSQRVLEKAGFVLAATHNEYKSIRGRDRGALVFEYLP